MSKKNSKIGVFIKRTVGIDGNTKETIRPMITYSSASIGSAAATLASSVHYSPYIMYIVGLSAGQVTLLSLLRSIWDAIIDPFIGFFIDRTRSRLGSHRVYIIFSALPYGAFFLLRWDPFSLVKNSSVNKILAYYLVISLCIATFESIFTIAHDAMLPTLAPRYFERTQYNSMTYIMNAAGMAPTQLVSAWIVGIKTTQEYTDALHPAIVRFMLVISIVLAASILISGITTKEPSSKNAVFPQADALVFFKELKQVFKNKAFRHFFFTTFLYLFGSAFYGNSSIHFLKYVAQRWDLRSQLQLASGFEAATFPINYALTKKYGKQKCAQITTPLLYVSTALGLFVKPQSETRLPWLMTVFLFAREIGYIVGYSGYGFTLSNIFPDVTDVDEMITGRRREATITTFRSFVNTMTGGFMSSAVGLLLEWFGVTDETAKKPLFKARATDINASFDRTFGLRLTSGFIPLIFIFLALRQLHKYKMTKTDHELMSKVIKERKENGFAEVSEDEKTILENIAGQQWGDMWVGLDSRC